MIAWKRKKRKGKRNVGLGILAVFVTRLCDLFLSNCLMFPLLYFQCNQDILPHTSTLNTCICPTVTSSEENLPPSCLSSLVFQVLPASALHLPKAECTHFSPAVKVLLTLFIFCHLVTALCWSLPRVPPDPLISVMLVFLSALHKTQRWKISVPTDWV